MSTRREGWVVVALLMACGTDVTQPTANVGGRGGAAASNGSTGGSDTGETAGSTSTTGGGGTFGPGGQAPVQARAITVESFDGDPEVGIDVVGHDGSGAVVGLAETDVNGVATVMASDDGMITVAYDTVVQTPNGAGQVALTTDSRMYTLASIGTETAIDFRTFSPRFLVENAPMILEVQASVQLFPTLFVRTSCESGGLATGEGTTNVEVRGCPGEPTFDVVIDTGFGPGMERVVLDDIPYASGSTVPITVTDDDLQPPLAEMSFAGPSGFNAAVFGYGADQELRSAEYASSSVSDTPFPLADGVTTWVVNEASQAGNRARFLTALPTTHVWSPLGLATPTLTVSGVPPRPQANWSYADPLPTGNGTIVSWVHFSTAVWLAFVPPGVGSFTFPELPPPLAAKLTSTGSSEVGAYAFAGATPEAAWALDFTEAEYGPYESMSFGL